MNFCPHKIEMCPDCWEVQHTQAQKLAEALEEIISKLEKVADFDLSTIAKCIVIGKVNLKSWRLETGVTKQKGGE